MGLTPIITCKRYSDYSSICPVGHDIECRREVELSMQKPFYWGAYADKYGGQVQVRSCDRHLKKRLTMSSPPPSPDPPVPLSLTGDYTVWLHSAYQ